MNPSEFVNEKTKEWFAKANNDLRSAELILEDPDPPTDTTCYHCQQAVEKYLKGLLTYYQIEFMKTHDLDYLCKLAGQKVNLGDYVDDILSLNKYVIEARYPADIPILYSIEEAKAALEKAKEITSYIKLQLSPLLQ